MTKRILIVDDEPDLLDVLSIIFRAYGFHTETAMDGVLALEAIARQKPDLVLLDVMMPHMNGIEVVKRLKEDPATCELPVVLLTAKAHEADRASGMLAGADAYLPKPFDNAKLIQTVQSFLTEAPR